MRGRSLELAFGAPFYDSIYTSLSIGFGFQTSTEIELKRDDTFALFGGRVITESGDPIPNAFVKVAGETAVTNDMGRFRIYLPLERQAEEQSMLIMCDGYEEVYREDECPSDELIYIMHPAKN